MSPIYLPSLPTYQPILHDQLLLTSPLFGEWPMMTMMRWGMAVRKKGEERDVGRLDIHSYEKMGDSVCVCSRDRQAWEEISSRMVVENKEESVGTRERDRGKTQRRKKVLVYII